MHNIKAKWDDLNEQLSVLSPRERLLIVVSVCVVLYLITDALLISPLYKKMSVNHSLVLERQEVVDTFEQGSATNAQNQVAQYEALLEEVAKMKADYLNKQEKIHLELSAKDMLIVLDTVLNANQNIELIHVNNLPPTSAHDADVLFLHPIELQARGSFFDLKAFVNHLEQLPVPVVFEQIRYEVETYPNARLDIKLNFLTQNKGFIVF